MALGLRVEADAVGVRDAAAIVGSTQGAVVGPPVGVRVGVRVRVTVIEGK